MARTRVSVPLLSCVGSRGRNGDTCQNNWHTGVSNLLKKTTEDAVERIVELRHRAPPRRPADRRRAIDTDNCCSQAFCSSRCVEFLLMDGFVVNTKADSFVIPMCPRSFLLKKRY